MEPKWIPLKEWLKRMYGDFPPHINTIHNWIKADKIQPPPEKHGRDYYFRPHAEYVADLHAKPTLLNRLRKVA